MKYYFLLLGTLVVVCVGCAVDGQQIFERENQYQAPPAALMQRPGPMVDGPGPGVMPPLAPPPQRSFATQTTQIRFVGPEGMQVGWKIRDGYAENQLMAPGRYDFRQGATYRLKLTNVPGRKIPALYPTLQVYPSHPTTDAYLSHNSVPVAITDEDLDQVETNNFVTKVIYLPDPRYQELAIAGVETLVSTRLDPGVDPVAEADRRGTIMAVLRIGNMDLEMPEAKNEPQQGAGQPGQIHQASYRHLDGDAGQHEPPMPVAVGEGGFAGVPAPMMMGAPGAPGQPAYSPIAGVGGAPTWGMPMTATPIGLPGPASLPYGRPASLKSHTVRNLSDDKLPKPVQDVLIDVKHEPGYRIPEPVRHVEYTETHPNYAPGEVAYPSWALPPQGP